MFEPKKVGVDKTPPVHTGQLINYEGYNYIITESGTLEYLPFDWEAVEYRL